MGSISFSQKCARRASDGSWNWGSMSGTDYVDNNSYNYYCVVYKANVSYGSGEYLTGLSTGVSIYAGGSTLALQGATVRCYIYTSDPTGGGSLPSGIASQSTYTDMTSTGQYYSFSFSGLNITSSTVYVGFTVDKPSQYPSTAHANANAGTAGISGTWDVPPAPTYCTLELVADTGIASVSGGGTKQVPGSYSINCSVQSGYQFDGWYDEYGTRISASQSYSLTIRTAITRTFTAKATLIRYSVTITPWDYIDSVSGEGSYLPGTSVTVTATLQAPTSSEEYVFDRWVDISTSQVVSRDNPYTFTISRNVWLEACGRAQPRGNARIYTGSAFERARVFIYDGTQWKSAIPYIYDGTQWKQGI